MSINLPQATMAVGALGAAATGLVDSTKAFADGISRAGFGYIPELIARTVSRGPESPRRLANPGQMELRPWQLSTAWSAWR